VTSFRAIDQAGTPMAYGNLYGSIAVSINRLDLRNTIWRCLNHTDRE